MSDFSHLDEQGQARMVDVGNKDITERLARASGFLEVPKHTMEMWHSLPKGNPVEVARIAGIQACKQTSQLIPMCHSLALTSADIEIKAEENGFRVRSKVRCTGRTGVEMEALTGASVALLTLYDMLKSQGHQMRIVDLRLEEKRGGKSDFEG